MRKLAVFSWSFALAVVADNYILPQSDILLSSIILVSILLGLGVWVRRCGERTQSILLICAGSIFGLFWMLCYSHFWFEPVKKLDDCTIQMAATVLEYPQETDYGYSVLVEMQDGSNNIKTLLYTDEQGKNLIPGDRISTIAHCTTANRSAQGEKITYYTAKGIFLWAQAYGVLEVEPVQGNSFRYVPALLSKQLKESIDRAFPSEYAGVVRAVVTGNRDHLTDRFTTSLQRTGLSHVVAVSGMHLACFSSMLISVLGRGRRGTALLVAAWAAIFCAVAGNTPSISRAAIMILLLQFAPLVRREADGLTSLSFSLLLLLLWNPFSVTHVGLQLSFASVAGIFLLSDRIEGMLNRSLGTENYPKNALRIPVFWMGRGIAAGISATLGAMVFTVPLTALYFGNTSLIAPISNLMTLWAISLLFAGGMLCGLIGIWFPCVAFWMAKPITWLVMYVQEVTQKLSQLSFAAIPMDGIYYRTWLIFVYLVFGVVLLTREKRRMIIPVCAVIMTLMLCVLCNAMEFRAGRGNVTVLDVGQGQSVLLRSGQCLMLVDCGGSEQGAAGNTAADFLQSKGYSELDFLVLTHDHADHANGVVALMERVNIHVLALPLAQEETALREEILAAAEEQETEIWFVSDDLEIKLPEGDTITLYAPMGEEKNLNECGLSVLSRCGTFEMLITGDMGWEGEMELLRQTKLPEVELFVAGHHGASSSSSEVLLDVIRPELAAISVGEYNTYGHPGTDTLQRLQDIGAEVYRTDLHSTITFYMN